MDINSLTAVGGRNSSIANSDALKNSAKNLSANSTEDELKSTLKEFESYFLEEIIKDMKDTFTMKDEEESSIMGQYTDFFMDTAIEELSDQILESSGQNFTQQLYEQMKRNYNIE